MAAETANTLMSYGDSSRKEDVVLNAIEILTARETQIFNMLGKTTAIDTVHSFLTDTLATAASGAIAETGDYSASATTTPTRNDNVVELVAHAFKVSRTQSNIQHYHGQNELSRQTEKVMLQWGNSAEFDLVRSTLVSGLSGTVPKLSKRLKLFLNSIILNVYEGFTGMYSVSQAV